MTFGVARSRFIGFGISWYRRSIFDYGHIMLSIPFLDIVLEWPPDREGWERLYGEAR